jgi:hypothetical protein
LASTKALSASIKALLALTKVQSEDMELDVLPEMIFVNFPDEKTEELLLGSSGKYLE